ncbi:SprT-like protein [Bacillus ectoiniformans]|uniref:SprT family protein n=1 Tax=Bacillus ectoiniformans TaxID=1494429 RepID=UPI0019578D2A|nr:SprT family protein [Bacillus ectoiniformans]MBM7649386.1 SprT-like protein [Bacillus ectoiniformans]
MDNVRLQQLTEQLSADLFGRPFLHQAFFNNRLKTTGGRYMLESHNIEINIKYYDEYGLEELKGIIKHELCHYHLHIEGKGYKHRDRDFKELMKKVDAPRYCTPLVKSRSSKQIRVLIYRCKNCEAVYSRRRKVNTEKYVCGKCKGKLKFIEEVKKTLT